MVRNSFLLLVSLQIVSLALATAQQSWCGKIGWDAGYESFASFDVGTYAGCSTKCSQYKQCKSFAYSSNDCQIYDKPVKGNFVADSGSTYSFYDATCMKSGATTSTTTTTTTTKATTKTTIKASTTTISAKTIVATIRTSTTTHQTTTTTISPKTTMSSGRTSTTTTAKVNPSMTQETTTSTTLMATSTGAPICNQQGYFTGDYNANTDVISTYQTSSNSKLGCYNYCKNNAGCVSYAYTTGVCFLYNIPLAGNFQPSTNENFYYFDMSCGAPPATTTTTTTLQPIATSGPICDQPGYFIGADEDTVSIEGYYGRLPKSTTTKLYCYDCCKGLTGCQSYAWNEGSCTLFNTTLAYKFQPDSASVAEFYDISCGAPPATSDDGTDKSAASAAVAAVDAAATASAKANSRFQIRR